MFLFISLQKNMSNCYLPSKVKKWKLEMEKWDFWVQIIVPQKSLIQNKIEAKKKAERFLFLPDSWIEGSMRKKFSQLKTWLLEHILETRKSFYNDVAIEMELVTPEEIKIEKYLDKLCDYLVVNKKNPQFDRNNLQKEFEAMSWIICAIAVYFLDKEKKYFTNLNSKGQKPSYMEFMDNLNLSQEKQAKLLDRAYCYHVMTIFQIIATEEKSCFAYGKDVRNWWEFAAYFSEGWVMEDIAEQWLSSLFDHSTVLENNGYKASCQLEGDDKDRKLCSGEHKPSGDPDFKIYLEKIEGNNKVKEVAKIELQKVKYYPTANNPIHIKTHKFKKSKAQNSLILLVFPWQWKFSLFHANEFANNAKVMKVSNLASWGNKPVHSISQKDIEEIWVYDFKDKAWLKKAINKILRVKSLVV